MNKSKRVIFIMLISLVIINIGIAAVAANKKSLPQQLGEAQKNMNTDNAIVVATFREKPIYLSAIDRRAIADEIVNDSDRELNNREILEKVLINEILVVEAENLGLSVTQDEIISDLDLTKRNYYDYPEVARFVDNYCASREIGIDEYWDIVEKSISSMILRAKMQKEYYSMYTGKEKNDINMTFEEIMKIEEAYKAYCQELLAKYDKDIVYYDN